MQREKKQIINDLKRTESVRIPCPFISIFIPFLIFSSQDMDDVKLQLQRCKKENNEIEKELRGR